MMREGERGRGGDKGKGLLALLFLIVAVMLQGAVQAQTLLRWKLKPGDSYAVEMRQATESQVAFSGKSATTKIDVAAVLRWDVTAADEQAITLKQTIEQTKVKLSTPQNAVVEFDSEANVRATGQTRELAEALKPLMGAEFEIKMDTRGNILEAKPANDASKSLLAGGDKAADGGSASRGVVEQLLGQSLVILPEKGVAADDKWTTTSDLKTAAGVVKLETTYTIASAAEEGVVRIETSSRLADPSAGGGMKIESHEQTGTILFSAVEGRVVEAEQKQKLVTQRPYRETTIVVTLNSVQKTSVRPVEK